jgi:probable F420-dependent oxidoreductase
MGFKVDVVLPPGPAAAGAAAKQMEAMGYDGLYTTDTSSDPFLDLVIPAAETTKPILGTNIAVAFGRSPFVTAMMSWKLQEASKGRFVLGLGTQVKGHIERRFGMTWDSPGPRFREYVQALKELFTAFRSGGQPSFRGKYYQHTLLTPFFRPGPIAEADPLIWLAAVNDYNAETVGLCADGIMVHPLNSPKYFDEVLWPAIDKGLKRSGRTRADITVMVPVFIVAGSTPEERAGADGFVRSQISFYGSTRSYRKVFEVHGWDDTPAKLHELQAQGDMAGMAATITDEMVDTLAIVCDPDDLPAKVRERYDGLADRIYLYNVFASIYARDEGRLREVIASLSSS